MSTLDSLLARVHEDLREHPGPIDVDRIRRLTSENYRFLDRPSTLALTAEVRDHIEGLGPLQPLLNDDVTDIMVNEDGSVWSDSARGLVKEAVQLAPEESRRLATRLASLGGRRLDDSMPWADAQLPGGIRFHAVLPPLSGGGALISIRRAASTPLSIASLEESGTLSERMARIIEAIVQARLAFLVSGGTGSGKTTLLGAMLAHASHDERLVIVEDATELRPRHPHVVHLQSRHANAEGRGEVSLGMLVRQCLRMRPDRIIVGECRGDEVRELLQALNTGHEGGGGTIHANTAADVPARLEALGALAGMDAAALSAQALSAIDVVIHLERFGQHRRVSTLALLEKDASGRLTATPALMWNEKTSSIRYFPAYGQLEARIGHLLPREESC